MENTHITFTAGNYKAEVVQDMYPDAPTDAGLAPTLTYETSCGSPVAIETFDNDNCMTQEIARHTEQMAAVLEEFSNRVSEPLETFKRYLHIFHAVEPRFIWEIAGGYRETNYISWASPEWIDAVGIADLDALETQDMLSEVTAWREGDVYGVIISERAEYVRKVNGEVIESATLTQWEEVDSCYGFYGSEYAELSARENLAAHAGNETITEES